MYFWLKDVLAPLLFEREVLSPFVDIEAANFLDVLSIENLYYCCFEMQDGSILAMMGLDMGDDSS